MKYLLVFLYAVSFAFNASANDPFENNKPQVAPPPEPKQIKEPVHIPEDYDGIKELSRLNKQVDSDQYFLLLKTAKSAKIEEMIAESQNKTAKSRAEIAELNSPKLSNPIVLPSAIQTADEKPRELKKPIARVDAVLSGISLVGIKSSTSIILKNQQGFFEANYNKPVSGIIVTSISAQSATVKSLKSGQIKVLTLIAGNIKPDMPVMKKKE